MKHIFHIFFLQLCITQTTYAQNTVNDLRNDSAKLYVEYLDYKGYIDDSTYTSSLKTSLFLGKKAAIYSYQRQSVETFIEDFKRNGTFKITEAGAASGITEESIKQRTANSLKENFKVEKILSEIYVRYYHSPEYLHLKSTLIEDADDYWVSDTSIYSWKPADQFKSIAGYKCQKAILQTADSNLITAWFTEEIPIPAGPLYLYGLPGLILEYQNPKSKRHFKAIAITSANMPHEYFRQWLAGPIISKQEYRNLTRDTFKKVEQLHRMIDTPNQN